MARTNINDLAAFVTVARERSFTRAGAQLGVSASALSHTLRGLEERLGVRLLTRTTRSVTPTEAGEQILSTVGPMLDEIDRQMSALDALRDKPAGTLRITADEYVISALLWPKLRGVLAEYPDIHLEIVADYSLADIAAERFDAGVRLGSLVAKDMIAVPIGPDIRFRTVAAPAYFAGRPKPEVPQDLTEHRCINLRLPTYGGLFSWEFEKGGQEMRVRVDGQLTFNSITPILQSALDGFGIAQLPDGYVQRHIERGELVEILPEWSPEYPGYHLYYPSRRQMAPAFRVVLDALRHRSRGRNVESR